MTQCGYGVDFFDPRAPNIVGKLSEEDVQKYNQIFLVSMGVLESGFISPALAVVTM